MSFRIGKNVSVGLYVHFAQGAFGLDVRHHCVKGETGRGRPSGGTGGAPCLPNRLGGRMWVRRDVTVFSRHQVFAIAILNLLRAGWVVFGANGLSVKPRLWDVTIPRDINYTGC